MSFVDVYFHNEEYPTVSYRSGLTVYEEIFDSGMWISSGWNVAGYPLDLLTGCQTRFRASDFRLPSAFRLTVNGYSLERNLQFEGVEVEDNKEGKTARVRLSSTLLPIGITVVTKLDGTGIFSRHLEIENKTGETVAISALSLMSGGVDITPRISDRPAEEVYRLGYMDADIWLREGDFNWHTLRPDKTTFGGRYERDRFRFPMFLLENRQKGQMMVAQMAYSGGYSFSFDLDAKRNRDASIKFRANSNNDRTYLSFSADVTGYAPLYRLEAGAVFTTPSLEIGMVQGDADAAVNAMNDHLRRGLFARRACVPLVGAGMGPEHDMSVATTKRYMEQMAHIGCEVFIVDAGWTCPPGKQGDWGRTQGDWDADPDRYPNGIKEIRDYCHSLGMKFGMWMEPERMGRGSKLAASHPDWWPTFHDGREATLLDLTREDAVRFVIDEISRVIEENELDLFRLDYNVDTRELFYLHSDGSGENASVKHAEAVYRIWKTVTEKYPEVIFENCASGGGRVDAGLTRFFHHTWVSDDQVPPLSRVITNGMSLVMPPERMDRLVAGMWSHELGSLDYHMRNAMTGHISMNVLSGREPVWNPEQLGFIRHSIEVYKGFIRPFLPTSFIYHHTLTEEEYRTGTPSVIEVASRDRDRAAITVLTSPLQGDGNITVRPRGIDPKGTYRVTLDNSGATWTVTGYELLSRGIPVYLPSALTSELILIEAE